MQHFLLCANWKLNPATSDEARRIFRDTAILAKKYNTISTVVFPPAVFLDKVPKGLACGAQDASFEHVGEHTGEISPLMIADMGATHVIVGHSEKRVAGDTSEIVAKKVRSVLDAGLTPIVCVGEKVRDEGGNFWAELGEQILESLTTLSKKEIQKVIIAYEPVFAIGAYSSGALDPADVHGTVIFIRKTLMKVFDHKMSEKVSILYGGSVSGDNAGLYKKDGYIQGLLVGHRSLHKDQLKEIYDALNNTK